MKPSAQEYLDALYLRYPMLKICRASIQQATEALVSCFSAGRRLYVCGNGGSAADAQHIVGELMKAFVLPRKLPECAKEALCAACPQDGPVLAQYLQGALPALSLAGETALVTAYANDVASEMCFAQQVYGYGQRGDALLILSTSGNSRNMLYAASAARSREMEVIALTGCGGGKLAARADVLVAVPETETFKIQELHLPIYHAICLALEETFFGDA